MKLLTPSSRHRARHAVVTAGLAVAGLLAVGAELIVPGHHVHRGGEVSGPAGAATLHHHHPFLGVHEHPSPPGPAPSGPEAEQLRSHQAHALHHGAGRAHDALHAHGRSHEHDAAHPRGRGHRYGSEPPPGPAPTAGSAGDPPRHDHHAEVHQAGGGPPERPDPDAPTRKPDEPAPEDSPSLLTAQPVPAPAATAITPVAIADAGGAAAPAAALAPEPPARFGGNPRAPPA